VGFDGLLVPEHDHQQELECIRRFGREVIPAFRTQADAV
jgi:hypothetical protein